MIPGINRKSFTFLIYEGDKNTHICMGKLDFNQRTSCGVMLFGGIKPVTPPTSMPNDEETCSRPHVITISVKALECGHSTLENTSEPTSNISHFGVFNQLETAIAVNALLAISILMSVALCVSRCSKISKSCNRSTPEGNPTPGTYDRGALETTDSPYLTEPQAIPLQVLAGNEHLKDNTTQKHDSRKSKEEQCGSVMSTEAEFGEKLTPTGRRSCGVSVITKEGDKRLTSNSMQVTLTLGKEKHFYENNSIRYRNVDENYEASSPTDKLEGYSSVEDAKSTGCDFASLSYANHQMGLPSNDTTHLAKEVYMNNPTRQKNAVFSYEMPDETWQSDSSVNLEPHSRSLSSLDDASYDILNRPEIEDWSRIESGEYSFSE